MSFWEEGKVQMVRRAVRRAVHRAVRRAVQRGFRVVNRFLGGGEEV